MLFIAVVVTNLFSLNVKANELQSAGKQAKQIVTYPFIANANDKRDAFVHDLLKLVFSDSETYHLQKTEIQRDDSNLPQLVARKKIDIGWSVVDSEETRGVRPIPFPVYRGLLGYRLILVHKDNKDILQGVSTLLQLGEFSVGQGKEWIESRIFNMNGFQTATSQGYEALFEMLRQERFDLFPRSILEISNEVNTFAGDELIIEDHVLLHYPLAVYYKVASEEIQLAKYIGNRLLALFASGEYDTLFQQEFANQLAQFNFQDRAIINIPNPLFPEMINSKTSYFLGLEELRVIAKGKQASSK